MLFSLQADDGFYIDGGMSFSGLSNGGPEDLVVLGSWSTGGGSDVGVSSVSPPWVAEGFWLDGDRAAFSMSMPVTPLADGSAPFTFYGSLTASGVPTGTPVYPLFYEFSGQGTAYFNINSSGDWPFAESVRYEFEAAPIPEPSTWGLLLAGLLALSRRRSARS